MGERKLVIGIPVYNDKKSFKFMIESLLNSTDYYDKIIIVESESTDGVDKFCDGLAKYYKRIEVIHTKKEGPLKAYNLLFQKAKELESDLFLTQTDVAFPKLYNRDWLELINKVSKFDDVSIVTTLNGGGISGPEIIEGFEWVGGWATYIPYKTIEKLGGFDENYIIGDLVDIDYSYAASKIGKIIKVNYWVDHHWQTAHTNEQRNDLQEIKQKNREYFKKKWAI
jgi:GT2 family glycosyltransferase